MPDGCTMLFDPFVASSVHEPLGLVPGNIYGQSREAVDIGDGTCKHLLARPSYADTGDIVAMTCNCPDGSVATLEPTWTDAGDVVWQEVVDPLCTIRHHEGIFPCFVDFTLPQNLTVGTPDFFNETWFVYPPAQYGAQIEHDGTLGCGDTFDSRRRLVFEHHVQPSPGNPHVGYGVHTASINVIGLEVDMLLFPIINEVRVRATVPVFGRNLLSHGLPPFFTLFPFGARWQKTFDIERDPGDSLFHVERLMPFTIDQEEAMPPDLPPPFTNGAMIISVHNGPESEFADDPDGVVSHIPAYIVGDSCSEDFNNPLIWTTV